MFFLRNSRFPVRSVFVINVSLFISVVCEKLHTQFHSKCPAVILENPYYTPM